MSVLRLVLELSPLVESSWAAHEGAEGKIVATASRAAAPERQNGGRDQRAASGLLSRRRGDMLGSYQPTLGSARGSEEEQKAGRSQTLLRRPKGAPITDRLC